MKNELEIMIAEWLNANEKLQTINSYLYEHTELYESYSMTGYKEDLFNFFAGKITRFGRDNNNLFKILANYPQIRANVIREKVIRK